MKRPLVIAAILSLIATAVLADMFPDASNSKLPEARQNLELGTVKSEGGDPPDAITRFYTWDKTHPQFQINSQPNALEWGVEQAGQAGQGATRLCYSNTSVVVNCNFVGLGSTSSHIFGNGAGPLARIGYTGTGPTTGWPVLLGGDDTAARVYADAPSGYPNAELYLKSKGSSLVQISTDLGTVATFANAFAGATDSYLSFVAGNAANPRVQAWSDAAADVTLRLLGKGTGEVTIENGNGILGRFDSGGAAPTTAWPSFLGVNDASARVIAASDSLTNVNLYLGAKGNQSVTVANTDGPIANFIGNGATPGYFIFTAAASAGGPAKVETNTSAGVQVTKLMLASQTVATLPACSAAYKYALAAVSDQNGAPTWRGALTGGGALAVVAFCNGAAWEAH